MTTCVMVYVGEIGWNLQQRIFRESKHVVKSCDMKNGIAAHAWKAQHCVDWSVRTTKRKVLELIHIEQEAALSNL